MLAFVPGIALQVPAVAAGPRSGARRRRRRRLRPARPLSCTLGLCPGLQLRAGLPLRSGQTPTAQPPPSYQAGPHRCALRLPSLSAASHRQTAASSDLVSPGRYLSRPQPLDSDSSSSPPPPPAPPPPPPPARGRPASHLQRDPFLPTPRHLLLQPDGCQVPGVPGSQIVSLTFSRGPVSFAQHPVLF